MFCPQCGTESPADLKFCRMCGTNLRVIGKAVTLSEAIARSDSVPSKIKDLVTNLKIEKVSDEVARAMEKVKQEITHTAEDHREWHRERTDRKRKEKTWEQRREKHLTAGLVTMFSGVGLSIFLYFLSGAIVLKLPPDVAADIPFELEPVIRVAWMVGLIPALTGFGRVIAGLTIRRDRHAEVATTAATPLRIGEPVAPAFDQQPAFVPRHDDEATVFARPSVPGSVTDRTTNILERQPQAEQKGEMR